MNMKIQLVSDIHLEYLKHKDDWPPIPNTNAEVIVLAGDIGEGTQGIEYAIEQSVRLDKDIVYVAGNHEYYGCDYFELMETLKDKVNGTRVYFLDDDSVILNGTRFIGATLWTNYGQGHEGLMKTAFMRMTDTTNITARKWWATAHGKGAGNKRIGDDDEPDMFIPEVAYETHKNSIDYLTQELEKPFDGKTVVVTHHAPTFKSIESLVFNKLAFEKSRWVPRLHDDLGIIFVAAYASDLTDLIVKHSNEIDLWAHGHTHCKEDYAYKGVRVVCNPRGRPHGTTLTDGDVTNFNFSELFDVNDGFAPPFIKYFNTQADKWDAILQEVEQVITYSKNEDVNIAELAAHRVASLAGEFNKITNDILLELVSNIKPAEKITTGYPDSQHDCEIFSSLFNGEQLFPHETYEPLYRMEGRETFTGTKPDTFSENVLNKLISIEKHFQLFVLMRM